MEGGGSSRSPTLSQELLSNWWLLGKTQFIFFRDVASERLHTRHRCPIPVHGWPALGGLSKTKPRALEVGRKSGGEKRARIGVEEMEGGVDLFKTHHTHRIFNKNYNKIHLIRLKWLIGVFRSSMLSFWLVILLALQTTVSIYFRAWSQAYLFMVLVLPVLASPVSKLSY